MSELRSVLTPAGRSSSSEPRPADGGSEASTVSSEPSRSPRSSAQRLRTFIASDDAEDLRYLGKLVEAGQVTPAIDRTYPLSEVPAAIRHLQEGVARGKVVITV